MAGFDFGGDTTDDTGPDAAAADAPPSAPPTADTVVSPADPEPLADHDSLADSHPSDSDAADGTDPHVDAMLYAGEEACASLPIANGTLVATTHRLLAYAPDADERATLRSVHRVNVTDVSVTPNGHDWLVRPTAYAVIGGLAMVVGGSVVSFDAMNTEMPQSAGAAGIGGLLSMIGGLLSVLSMVDDALRVLGSLSLLVGVALMGLYLYTRGHDVVVETEGEADTLRVAAGDADSAEVERFVADAGLDDGDDEGDLFRL
ncbi:hypothetical protein [Halobaculum limi]|uniref:hypothetical protein n=1 Tax=Halobaculum limi TaxID=3031916 RepID=UPI0024063620|nr:hypothetical protein [Halobaculum sp. YSMS11]